MKKIAGSSLFDNKTFCKVISVIGAVVIWAIITLTSKTNSERLIRNVPIDFSLTGTAVEALGLNAFERSDEALNIRLAGNRSSINAVSKEDFIVTLSTGRVTKAGKYTVKVDVSLKEEIGNAEIIDYSPKSIQVSFDRTATKTLPVTVDISNISAKNGFMLDKGYPSVPEVTVSGPESVIKSITSCVADIDAKNSILEETLAVSEIPLFLIDENGNKVNNPFVVIDKEVTDVSVPVLKVKELPIFVHFINMPANFVEKDFKYTISSKDIQLAGPEETIDAMTQLDVRYVDLKTTKPGDVVTLNVELPAGFVNLSNTQTVDVTIPSDNITRKLFSVREFKVIGAPEDSDVRFVTKRLNNVTLYGDKNILKNIAANDIVVEVNLSGTTLSGGTMTVPATITVPGKTGVFWAYGDYEVVIRS